VLEQLARCMPQTTAEVLRARVSAGQQGWPSNVLRNSAVRRLLWR
jgi:hypothetical protein